ACRIRNEDRLSKQFPQAECLRVMQIRHQVLTVQNADNIVENATIDRKSRVARAFDHSDDFLKERAGVDGRHFHARHHDSTDLAFQKFPQALQQTCRIVTLRRLVWRTGMRTYPRIKSPGVRRLGIAPELTQKFSDLRAVSDQDEI